MDFINKISSKLRKMFKPRNLVVIFSTILLALFITSYVSAGFQDMIATMIGWIIFGIVWALGQLLVLVMEVLVWIAQWSNFIYAPAVVLGWKIVRDICNMFFVVIMIIIAFATILGVKSYRYEALLPKLILMAIMINFSKMICGLLIDVSQVVMLTFVNSFKEVVGSNLTKMLGIDAMMDINVDDKTADITLWSILGSYILALIYVIVALITLVTMVGILAMRIVMIWIYVVLSPAAYLLGAFPAGKSYNETWWKDFTKNLIVGPILAFFIWLSFAALGTGTGTENSGVGKDSELRPATSTALTKAGSPDNMLNFIISIAMLYGGLMITQQVGGAAGGMAGKGMAAVNKGVAAGAALGTAAAVFGKRKTLSGARRAGAMAKTGLVGADRLLGAGADKVASGVFKKKSNLGSKGLLATAGGLAVNSPGMAGRYISRKVGNDKAMDQKRVDYFENKKRIGDEAVLSHEGKSYKADKIDGKLKEWDENIEDDQGNKVGGFAKKDGKENVLQNKNGNEVTEMNAAQASFSGAYRNSFAKISSEDQKKKEEKVTAKQKEMADKNMSSDEIARILESSASSQSDRMAAALTLAATSGFRDAAQVLAGKKVLGGNDALKGKFNDDMDKNQTHLNYDFNNEADVAKFKSRIDQGKIDPTKMQAAAYADKGVMTTLQDYHGKDFERAITSVAGRSKKYEQSVSKGLLLTVKEDKNNPGHIDPNDKSATVNAKITGEIENSFTIKGADDKPHFDVNTAGKALKTFRPAELNGLDLEEIKKLTTNDKDFEKKLLESVDYAKLKGMKKEGSNDELVEFIKNLHISTGSKSATAILNDNELTEPTPPPPPSSTSSANTSSTSSTPFNYTIT